MNEEVYGVVVVVVVMLWERSYNFVFVSEVVVVQVSELQVQPFAAVAPVETVVVAVAELVVLSLACLCLNFLYSETVVTSSFQEVYLVIRMRQQSRLTDFVVYQHYAEVPLAEPFVDFAVVGEVLQPDFALASPLYGNYISGRTCILFPYNPNFLITANYMI